MTRLVALLMIAACGKTTGSGGVDAPLRDGPAGDEPAGSGAASGSAAMQTATQSAACTAIAPFYWEIGDGSGAIVSGSTGTGVIKATTSLNIASASKLWWGAYVVERFASDPSQIDRAAMEMQSGRTNFGTCTGASTVADCCAKTGLAGSASTNCDVIAGDVGYFYYSGGHFEGYAQQLGLGSADDAALASAYTSVLGADLAPAFTQPQPAGGMKMSASDYARFLRKILSGGLAIHDHLGGDAVCTLPGSCATAHYSPSPLAWHYSYGHWVEDEPGTGDGAFSSPGKFGFYPWIDATKHYYGIVAREDLSAGDGTAAGAPYYKSVLCGRAIRKAFFSGVAQP